MEYQETRLFGIPGAGKTTALSKLVVRAVQARGSDAVMVCSFTKAAAVELASRGLPMHPSQVATLHAHAYRALGVQNVVSGPLLRAWNDAYPDQELSGAASDMDDPYATERLEYGATATDKLMAQIEVLRNRLIDRRLWTSDARMLDRLWTDFKREHDAYDFTDMIEVALAQIDAAPGNPSVIFVDEVQDLTPLQIALARKWGQAAGRVVMAGDDDQCIYGFTGASPDAFLDPPIPAEQVKILGYSYRVPWAVLRYAESWIGQVSRRQEKHYAPRREVLPDGTLGDVVEGAVVFAPKVTPQDGARLVHTVTEYLGQGKSVMVLASTNALLRDSLRAFRQVGLPFSNKYRRRNGAWNPLYRRRDAKATADRLLAYLRPRTDVWGSQARPWTTEDFKLWAPMVQADQVFVHGVKSQIRQLLDHEPMPWHYFTQAGIDAAGKLSMDWLLETTTSEYQKTLAYPVAVLKARGAEALWREPRLTVGTIHSVKGGEADVVLLFRDLSNPGAREWNMPGSAEHDGIIRMFYVGMTRARETLVVCGSTPGGPSVRLPEQVPDVQVETL
jgi:DNA helicase II / ATP-dependent DNA helicase PcrA